MRDSEVNVIPSIDPKDKYIFDQYSRYLPVSKIIGAVVDSKTSSVLDIGSGDECILGELLPEYPFTFIDPLLADKEGGFGNHKYLAGSIFDSRLDGCTFGAVTSVDVLEHIPKDEREVFLSRVSELATNLVVLAFPCEELPSEELDRKLNVKYRSIFGKNYPWLEEHFEFGMPSVNDVDAFFQSKGWNTYRFGQGHIPWLDEFLGFSLPGLEAETLRNAVFDFSKVFNEIAAGDDISPPFYRYVFIASKEDISGQLAEVFPVERANERISDLTTRLRGVFYESILRAGKNQSAVLSGLIANGGTLSKQLNASQASEGTLSEQLNASQLMNQELESETVKEIASLNEKINRHAKSYSELMSYQTKLKAQLEMERFSVARPLLRRLYRFGVGLVLALPPRVQQWVRSIKQRVISKKVALQLPSFSGPLGAPEAVVPLAFSASLLCDYSGYDVIVFPVIDWHFRVQRPQHLAKGLAGNGHRVFYLSVLFEAGEPGIKLLEQVDDRVFICQVVFPEPHPSIYEQMPSESQKDFLVKALDELISSARCGQVVALVDHPFWSKVAQAVPGVSVIYDCMDDHGGFSNNGDTILRAEQKMLLEADAVVTTSARLSEKIGAVRENTIIRNAAESAWFSKPPQDLLYHTERPVVGYYGAISEWFDIDLVVASAKHYPDYDFVLVGSTHMCDTRDAKKVKNIHFIGEVPYTDLKGYLYAFDICLIPFKLIELIQCTNPVKLYEYMAAGKPVVVTDMPELRLVKEHVYLSTDQDGFISNIKKAMDEKDSVSAVAKRKDFACKNDWQSRVTQMESLVEGMSPLVSIIVLTYNNWEFTEECLDSLELNTNYPNWELIVVDNASADGTPEFLREYAASREHVSLILNDENLGFAAGNNVGLKLAKGEYQILLNNDTYVTPGWLNDLIRHFDDDEIGLVGPVTNNIGNEAKLDLHYANMSEMVMVSRAYTRKHSREHIFVDTAAFFCVAIRKEVIEKVGLLDEAFGRGFFEDDDYCIRARKAGYKVAIADDVFVHHHLSASFNKLKDDEKQGLFEKNKAIYESKWGEWKPHAYRPEFRQRG